MGMYTQRCRDKKKNISRISFKYSKKKRMSGKGKKIRGKKEERERGKEKDEDNLVKS